ncbi:hypothetical protein LCGC14_0938990 [marine sediment metagenome]|uniref:7-cyano-7-deazaguanine synthase n=1 Tax=marine sediment metagenome TaxID=412755 RepID=A0A0F9R4A2_9ZZZZ
MEDAIVLLSGGMDSCTLLAHAVLRYHVKCVSFVYGSKHERQESQAALEISEYYRLSRGGPCDTHQFVHIPQIFKNSGLIDSELPHDRKLEEMEGIAPSYVPMRNTVLLGIAGSIADAEGTSIVLYGAHVEDHVGYPDCRPEWVAAMSAAMMIGSKNRVYIEAPWIWWHKKDIVKEAARLGAPLHLTYSCYEGGESPCGRCDTCIIRIKAFTEAGYIDPVFYADDVVLNWDTHLGQFPRSEVARTSS